MAYVCQLYNREQTYLNPLDQPVTFRDLCGAAANAGNLMLASELERIAKEKAGE